jgi:predicted GIY-YIG superfamily endonuclease
MAAEKMWAAFLKQMATTWADAQTQKYFDGIKDATSEELRSLRENSVDLTKGKYLCYFLRSERAPMRTYSGCTNDFPHRLRQHNGIISGGARMTQTTRPWRVACLVLGFPDQRSALRFEYFTKTSHTKIQSAGLNALQRRAALMTAAEHKTAQNVRRILRYHAPDPYFRECVEVARDAGGILERMLVGSKPKEPRVCGWHEEHGAPFRSAPTKQKEEPPVCFVSPSF